MNFPLKRSFFGSSLTGDASSSTESSFLILASIDDRFLESRCLPNPP